MGLKNLLFVVPLGASIASGVNAQETTYSTSFIDQLGIEFILSEVNNKTLTLTGPYQIEFRSSFDQNGSFEGTLFIQKNLERRTITCNWALYEGGSFSKKYSVDLDSMNNTKITCDGLLNDLLLEMKFRYNS